MLITACNNKDEIIDKKELPVERDALPLLEVSPRDGVLLLRILSFLLRAFHGK